MMYDELGIKFEKVSFEQFLEALVDAVGDVEEDDARNVWEEIKLPTRATGGSMGYDFYCPYTEFLEPGKSVVIPTGVRIKLPKPPLGAGLIALPRSGLGFKYGIVLDNTAGVIDSDYYDSANEGHIKLKMHSTTTDDVIAFNAGDRIAQGLIIPYLVTDDDNTTAKRDGGFGSTGE